MEALSNAVKSAPKPKSAPKSMSMPNSEEKSGRSRKSCWDGGVDFAMCSYKAEAGDSVGGGGAEAAMANRSEAMRCRNGSVQLANFG